MILVIDVGNTNITFGVYESKKLVTTFRMTSRTMRTSDEYGTEILAMLQNNQIDRRKVGGAIIASVVPKVMHALIGAVVRYLHTEPLIVGSGIKTGIKITSENPKEIGPDRIVDLYAQQMILLNLELFLLTLRREREEKADDSKRFELTEETAHLKSSRLIQVVHYMQEHVQEQIDMNTLCDVFYMSRSTLQHLFHKEFGCGPMEYFSRMKIRRAREMMREENCNITEIAARLSYGSVQYFSRQFKKEMGMSPMEYLSSVKGITQALR